MLQHVGCKETHLRRNTFQSQSGLCNLENVHTLTHIISVCVCACLCVHVRPLSCSVQQCVSPDVMSNEIRA